MTYILTSLLCCDILEDVLVIFWRSLTSCCFSLTYFVDVPALVPAVDSRGGDDVQGGHVRDAGGVSAAALLRVPEEEYDIQI